MTESTEIAAPPVTPALLDHLFADPRTARHGASLSWPSIGVWPKGRAAVFSPAPDRVAGLIR